MQREARRQLLRLTPTSAMGLPRQNVTTTARWRLQPLHGEWRWNVECGASMGDTRVGERTRRTLNAGGTHARACAYTRVFVWHGTVGAAGDKVRSHDRGVWRLKADHARLTHRHPPRPSPMLQGDIYEFTYESTADTRSLVRCDQRPKRAW